MHCLVSTPLYSLFTVHLKRIRGEQEAHKTLSTTKLHWKSRPVDIGIVSSLQHMVSDFTRHEAGAGAGGDWLVTVFDIYEISQRQPT